MTYPTKLTPEQEAIVLERRRQWRLGLMKILAAEFGCSVTTIRRIERDARMRGQNLSYPRRKL